MAIGGAGSGWLVGAGAVAAMLGGCDRGAEPSARAEGVPATIDGHAPQVGADPALAALVERGRVLYERRGCIACHSVDPADEYSTSTNMAGYFGSRLDIGEGVEVVADEAFIRESIVEPGKVLRPGAGDVMAPVQLEAEEVDAIVAYIVSLGGDGGSS